jgi:hypothetical protein
MNIIELKENEISAVSGGMGYMPNIIGFLGGQIGIVAATFVGVVDQVLALGGISELCNLAHAFAKPKRFFLGAAAITVVFLAANIGGAAIGWVISRPLVWAGLVEDK